MSIKDLIELAGKQGKVVIVDEAGEVRGVFLSADSFAAMSGRIAKPQALSKEQQESIVEKINKEILRAQLQETDEVPMMPPKLEMIPQVQPHSESSIGDLISKRAEELFQSKPFGRSEAPLYDMRAEVVDPNFGKPQVDVDVDEEIRPSFDDL